MDELQYSTLRERLADMDDHICSLHETILAAQPRALGLTENVRNVTNAMAIVVILLALILWRVW